MSRFALSDLLPAVTATVVSLSDKLQEDDAEDAIVWFGIGISTKEYKCSQADKPAKRKTIRLITCLQALARGLCTGWQNWPVEGPMIGGWGEWG